MTTRTNSSSMPTTSDGAWWADKPDATLQQYINTLDSGQRWASTPGTTTVTYNVMNQAPSNGAPTEAVGFAAFNSAQRAAVAPALQSWSEVANVRFVETTGLADINLGTSSTTEGGGTYSRTWIANGAIIARSDVWLSSSWSSNLQMEAGQYGMTTLIHELGHTLGLNHAGHYDASNGQSIEAGRLFGNDDRQHSIMSYFQSPVYQDQNLYPSSPMVMDIATIQSMYGANTTTRTGNDTYKWADGAGFISAIWDAGGTDTIDAGNQSLRAIINLNAGSFSSIGSMPNGGTPAINNLAIAYGATIENAIGGSGDDTLLGNSGTNILTGGAGADILDGEGGNDSLGGGIGDDSYLFEGAWGQDTVVDASGNNGLIFKDLDRSQLQFSRSGNNLLIKGSGSNNQVTVTGYYAAGSSYTLADSGGIFTFPLLASSVSGGTTTGAQNPETGGATPAATTLAANTPVATTLAATTPVVASSPMSGGSGNADLTLTALAGVHTKAGRYHPDSMDSALVTVRDLVSGHGPPDHYRLTASAGKRVTARMNGMTANADLYLRNGGGHQIALSSSAGNDTAYTPHNLPPGGYYAGVEGHSSHTNYSLSVSCNSGSSPPTAMLGMHAPLQSLAYNDGTGLGNQSFAMVEDSGIKQRNQLGMLVGKG